MVSVYMNPPEVFRRALSEFTSGIFIIHNHPGGDIRPSPADIERTERLKKGADILGINLYDHIIIGNDEYFSFSEHELLHSDK